MLCDEIYNQIDSLPGIKYGSIRIELNDGVQNNIDVDPDKFTCNCSIN